MFGPPSFLCEPLSAAVVGESLLFDTPVVREQSPGRGGSGFDVDLQGDFAVGDEYWELVAEMANWLLEIRSDARTEKVEFAISSTKKTLGTSTNGRVYRRSIPHPEPDMGPYFHARVFVREGSTKLSQDQRVWAAGASGIRVFLEGFRILPYGESNNDWLSLDADYTKRPRQLEMLRDFGIGVDGTDPDIGLVRVPSNNYYGAVFLTQHGSMDMRVLVNREGFVPDIGFQTLVRLVRLGVDLLTRERAAASYEERVKRRVNRREGSTGGMMDRGARALDQAPRGSVDVGVLPERIQAAIHLVREATVQLTGNAKEISKMAMQDLDQAIAFADELISERALLHVLASVGTQMAAFVHEINGLLGAAQTMEYALEEVLDGGQLPLAKRDSIKHIRGVAADLRRSLERQASYLTDVIGPDARRRRSRQPIHKRFDSAVGLVRNHALRLGISIENDIPKELKSPPLFPAELTAVFANLLTNAVKAAAEGGRIRAAGVHDSVEIRIFIQNTGATVRLDDAERWFKPFESTTSEVDPVLGQGMGLGLTISRNILGNYGARIRFVSARRPFSTAVEISFPNRS